MREKIPYSRISTEIKTAEEEPLIPVKTTNCSRKQPPPAGISPD
jgi:hypothetical protein